jgi:hypothetical protein
MEHGIRRYSSKALARLLGAARRSGARSTADAIFRELERRARAMAEDIISIDCQHAA